MKESRDLKYSPLDIVNPSALKTNFIIPTIIKTIKHFVKVFKISINNLWFCFGRYYETTYAFCLARSLIDKSWFRGAMDKCQ